MPTGSAFLRNLAVSPNDVSVTIIRIPGLLAEVMNPKPTKSGRLHYPSMGFCWGGCVVSVQPSGMSHMRMVPSRDDVRNNSLLNERQAELLRSLI